MASTAVTEQSTGAGADKQVAVRRKHTLAVEMRPRDVTHQSAFRDSRFERELRNHFFHARIARGTAKAVAAIVEYLVAESLEDGAVQAARMRSVHMTNRHLMLGMKKDVDIDALHYNVVLPNSGSEVYMPQKFAVQRDRAAAARRRREAAAQKKKAAAKAAKAADAE